MTDLKVNPTEQTGGRGTYCSAPEFKSSYYYTKDKVTTGISFFKFPKDRSLRKKWKSAMAIYRRKGGADAFQIMDTTVICERHFLPDHIKVSKGIGRKTLIKGSIPSQFKFNVNDESPKRKPQKYRVPIKKSPASAETTDGDTEEPMVVELGEKEEEEIDLQIATSTSEKSLSTELLPSALLQEIEDLKKEKQALIDKNIKLKDKIQELQNENIQLKSAHVYSYENISKDKKLFKKNTGIEPEMFNLIYNLVKPGLWGENIKYYDASNLAPNNDYSNDCKPGPRPKLNTVEQLFMFLSWLKNGFSLFHTSWLFNVAKSTTSRYIITWINLLYFELGSIPIWPSVEQIRERMPESFRTTYPSTRCIIDCTELFCQKPSSLRSQSKLYSNYKHHVTYKGLLGISPTGAITYVSELYEGSISDKEIVHKSGFLDPRLWNNGDSVMADRGFLIHDDLKELNVSLNIPAFLSGRSQLSTEEVCESQTIASVRIHVERAIRRIKVFRQLRNEISLSLHGSVNQLWTVTALLCNFLPPLIQNSQ